ncbi:MAG: hypothetical protein R6Y91_01800 [Desulfohalobium sp.]
MQKPPALRIYCKENLRALSAYQHHLCQTSSRDFSGLKEAGGIPAHGNQRSECEAGCRADHPNPEYR